MPFLLRPAAKHECLRCRAEVFSTWKKPPSIGSGPAVSGEKHLARPRDEKILGIGSRWKTAVHRLLLGVDRHGSVRPAPKANGLEEAMVESMLKEFETQVATGYLFPDPDGACYRPTWKGAVLMTWRLCWPVSAIVRSARKRATASLLKTLGA
jgi:hypothetical protein